MMEGKPYAGLTEGNFLKDIINIAQGGDEITFEFQKQHGYAGDFEKDSRKLALKLKKGDEELSITLTYYHKKI